MDHLYKIAFNRKMWHQFENFCNFSSCTKAQLCNRSHLQLDLPVCKNMVLPGSSAFVVSTMWQVRLAGRIPGVFYQHLLM
jgi:hypothetical protein